MPTVRTAIRAAARSIGNVIGPALLLALALALVLVLGDAHLVLDYIRTLIWPTVAAYALWLLRVPLREKVRDLLKVGGPLPLEFAERAATAQLGETVQQVSAELREASEQDAQTAERRTETGTTASLARTSGTAPTPGAPNGQEDHRTPEERVRDSRLAGELLRRRAVEKITEEAANWGHRMAKLGVQEPPAPHISWENGRPRIEYRDDLAPEKKPSSRPQMDRVIYARNVEGEVRRLERELYNRKYGTGVLAAASGLLGADTAPLERQLKDTKAKLQAADPNSALLP